MTKTLTAFFAVSLLFCQAIFAQRVGIGTSTPLARLAVDSGIMIDQANLNQGNLVAGALQFGSDGLVGIARSTVNGSGARKGISFFTNGTRRMTIDSVGRVGIGTTAPLQAFQVSGNVFVTGNIGVGNITDPLYDLHVSGSARIGGFLGINADPSSSFSLNVSGDAYFQNSNMGINIAPSSVYSLYAAGSVRFTDAVRIDGELNPNNPLIIGNNTSVAGSLTVGGRGIVRSNGSAQWRLVRVTVGYSGGIAANSDVLGAALGLNLGGATLAGIFVGPIVQVGAGASNLQSIGLVPADVSNTGCRFIITNASGTNANLGTNETPTVWQLTLLVFD